MKLGTQKWLICSKLSTLVTWRRSIGPAYVDLLFRRAIDSGAIEAFLLSCNERSDLVFDSLFEVRERNTISGR
ncbi:hypothetical protein F0562_021850 [Nyssa sinensis]|uniref:Uncharacterized protein n=1 Tax=Nyssa sinensis TaxID=561372 RepID=A0A5J5BLK8_9ASTE|nr:hypothetical protein F0562_021850 [Nyssa sinensis]